MENNGQPATKADLHGLEQRLEGKLDAVEQRILDKVFEVVRDAGMRILQAFYGFTESSKKAHESDGSERCGLGESSGYAGRPSHRGRVASQYPALGVTSPPAVENAPFVVGNAVRNATHVRLSPTSPQDMIHAGAMPRKKTSTPGCPLSPEKGRRPSPKYS